VSGAISVAMAGASRVYFGLHYPSDVLAGWAASMSLVLGLKLMFDLRQDRHEKKGYPMTPLTSMKLPCAFC
jgi:membrane-associated phospholipid phosphatase